MMKKFIEGKKILCEVDNSFYNLKIGYLYNIDRKGISGFYELKYKI
jgi:hypothetical protein